MRERLQAAALLPSRGSDPAASLLSFYSRRSCNNQTRQHWGTLRTTLPTPERQHQVMLCSTLVKDTIFCLDNMQRHGPLYLAG